MKIVLDTNVLLSGLISSLTPPAQVLLAIEGRDVQILLSGEIFAEYVRVVQRPSTRRYIRLSDEAIHTVLENLHGVARLIDSPEPVYASADPDDDKFLACAVAGNADCIVSGDTQLLDLGSFRDIPILTPAAFLHWMEHSTDNE
jgi:uncharacterized protein